MSVITVLGSINLDCVAWADRLPIKGESLKGNNVSMTMGGKGANQAVQAARIGAETYLIGCVGGDHSGAFIYDELKKSNIDTTNVKMDENLCSGTCCIHVDENGDNALIVAPQSNLAIDYYALKSSEQTIKKSDVFISQLETNLSAVEYAIQIAYFNNVTTILNPAPAAIIPEQMLQYVDYFTPNETEAEFYTNIYRDNMKIDEWEQAVAEKLLSMGAKNVVITMGEKGVYFANKDITHSVEAFEVEAVDTTAAGDAFNAAFAYALTLRLSYKEALEYGCAAGAVASTKKGASISLGDKDEIEAILRQKN